MSTPPNPNAAFLHAAYVTRKKVEDVTEGLNSVLAEIIKAPVSTKSLKIEENVITFAVSSTFEKPNSREFIIEIKPDATAVVTYNNHNTINHAAVLQGQETVDFSKGSDEDGVKSILSTMVAAEKNGGVFEYMLRRHNENVTAAAEAVAAQRAKIAAANSLGAGGPSSWS